MYTSIKGLFRFVLVFVLLWTQTVFSISNIELSTTSGSFTNQAPTYPTTAFTVPAGTNTLTIPISDQEVHYVGQYGSTTVVNESWTTESLDHQLCDPVVVGSPEYDVDTDLQRTKRFKNMDQDSFEVKVDYSNGALVDTTPVHWVVMESGAHTLSDGTQLQAGSETVSVVRARLAPCDLVYEGTLVNFSPAFSGNPVVSYSVSSDTDTTRTDAKVHGTDYHDEPTTTQMYMTLDRSFNTCVHGPETVDYIAWEETHLTTNGITIDTQISDDSVACCSPGVGYAVPYTSAFTTAPETVVVSQLGEDGTNGGFAVLHSNPQTAAQSYVSIDEDGTGADRGHTDEITSQVAISNDAGYFVTENTLKHAIGGADAAYFTLLNGTGSVADGIQLEFKAPPTCAKTSYTITIQSKDNHQCDAKSTAITPITITIDFADADGDGYDICDDCDDSDASIYPGATETCNGSDMDCDGSVDEGCDRYCDDDDTDGYIAFAPLYGLGTNPLYEKMCDVVTDMNGGGCSGGVVGAGYTAPSCASECTPSDGRTQNDADSDGLTYPGAPELCDINLGSSSGYMFDHERDQDCSVGSFNGLDDSDDDTDTIPACADNCPTISNTDQADSNGYEDASGSGDVCELFCGNGLIAGDEECDDGNAISGDGCSGVDAGVYSCQIEYCRDDAPLHDTSKNFVITDLSPTVIAGTSSQPNSQVAICFEDTDTTRNVFYTITDANGSFTYTPSLAPYTAPRVNVGIMLHDENGLDSDHHALMLVR